MAPGHRAALILPILGLVVLVLGFLTVPFETTSLCIPDTIDANEYQAFVFVRERLPWDAVIQRAPEATDLYLSIPNWGWRLTLAGDYHGVRRWFVNPVVARKTVDAINSAFKTNDAQSAHGQFKQLRIDYVYLGKPERDKFDAANLAKFESQPRLFNIVYENCAVQIVKVI